MIIVAIKINKIKILMRVRDPDSGDPDSGTR